MSFFAQKVCLITGASRGIGAALAREIARRQGKLVLFARSEKDLSLVKESLPHTDVLIVPGDVTRDEDIETLVARAVETFGGIDVVFANAGTGIQGKIADLTLEDIRFGMEVNFFGVVRTIKATLPHLRQRPHSRLGIVSSVAGKLSLATSGAYSATKFALQGLGHALRVEEEQAGGPKVTLICPGFVESSIHDAALIRGEMKRDRPPRILVMPTEKAARQMVNAVARGVPEVTITGHGKAATLLQRLAPILTPTLVSRRVLKRLR